VRHSFLITIFSIVLCGAATAEDLLISGARLTEYGIFEEHRQGQTRNAETSAGYKHIAVSQKLVEKTDIVPANLHTTFGITYVIEGSPRGKEIEISIVLLHPEITNPETGEKAIREDSTAGSTIGESNYDSFTFDSPWELAPGKWTFQIFHEKKLLVEQTFEVKSP
jgi:hypothetical protein